MSRDKARQTLLPFDEACARIFGLIKPLAPCHIATENADGLVLAQPAVAQRTSPATALSAMDGYAVKPQTSKSVAHCVCGLTWQRAQMAMRKCCS